MSITRDEWIRMFELVKSIEKTTKSLGYPFVEVKKQRILNHTDDIKRIIQSVVGQLE